MTNELRPWFEALITPERIERDGFFDAERVNKAWQEYLAGDHTAWGGILWRVAIFQSWYESF